MISRATNHGGSALPGKVVETLDPGFLARTLGKLPYGVVLISGTNGKTTTTRMVASMLRDAGLRVFTNPTGSNFTRGVVAALVQEMPVFGTKLDADIAVLELDEAYAVHFVNQIKPQYSLLLNVMRDQLDRFGEIDTTAKLLSNVAHATKRVVVLNREDPRISALSKDVLPSCKVKYFGLDESLRSMFPTDDDLHSDLHSDLGGDFNGDSRNLPHADVVLAKVADNKADFLIDGHRKTTSVKLRGVYNVFNAAAASTIVRAILADAAKKDATLAKFDDDALMEAISRVTPAFGRGEVIEVNGAPVELVLVKNPIGFRLALASDKPANHDTMIAICDEYADGRDMSWLWDVDFTCFSGTGVTCVSGTRAWDMALRLQYDKVASRNVNTNLEEDVIAFVNGDFSSDAKNAKRIYCTYTAMLRVRSTLGQIASVKDVGVGK
ncbi:MurT ligase domain-containing protein [Gardnerella vaginalis]|uniref:Mur ligase family protein n=1 Tax=Gardnerella vaginalis TaxID=2702 RepID=UPI00200CDEB3|nr:Mur ligase family protein [Gardnerella vaginalis]UQA78333.1 MurT ligase domain-containing protein [Gardnerella vaginalis]UQA81908.1 MurT ligase domain-containing protein [Gardnerella vaginalis]